MLHNYRLFIRSIQSLVLAAGFSSLPSWAEAQTITADPSFGTAGSTDTGLAVSFFNFSFVGAGGPQWSSMGQTVISNGKILVCSNLGNQFEVRCYNADGTPDPAFGTNGTVATAFPRPARAGGLAVQPDGKIVVVGGMQGDIGDVWAAARYLPNGTLDATFGTGGLAYAGTPNPGNAGPSELARVVVLPNGKLLAVASYVRMYPTRLLRLTSSGQPDNTFGPNNSAFSASYNGQFEALTVQPDGKILVATTTVPNAAVGIIRVARYLPDGTPDTAFGTNGESGISPAPYLTTQTVPYLAYAHDMLVQPDGKILLAGHGSSPQVMGTPGDAAFLVRLNADGTPDAAFNTTAHRSLIGTGGLSALALYPDGRILVGGASQPFGRSNMHLLLARYLSTGALDASFCSASPVPAATSGTYTSALGSAALVRALAVLPNGQFLATEAYSPTASSSTYNVRLTRYQATPLATHVAKAVLQLQAAPVPAATELRLRYELPTAAPVRVLLRDVVGRTVRVTAPTTTTAGFHEITLSVATLPAGTYLATLEAGILRQTLRVAVAP